MRAEQRPRYNFLLRGGGAALINQCNNRHILQTKSVLLMQRKFSGPPEFKSLELRRCNFLIVSSLRNWMILSLNILINKILTKMSVPCVFVLIFYLKVRFLIF